MDQQYEFVMDRMKEGLHLVPQHMRHGIALYVDKGLPHIGSFLFALLSNDFMEILGRGDDTNLANLKEWGQFLYNYVPRGCYGSPDRVRYWQAAGGATGLYRASENTEAQVTGGGAA